MIDYLRLRLFVVTGLKAGSYVSKLVAIINFVHIHSQCVHQDALGIAFSDPWRLTICD